MQNNLSIFAILILAVILIAFTESRTITGKVTDDQGQPISGVSIIVTGKSAKLSASAMLVVTTTDSKGHFKVNIDQHAESLVFSLQGYAQLKEKIRGRNVINVVMVNELSESEVIEDRDYMIKGRRESKLMLATYGSPYPASSHFPGYNNNINTEGYASINENGYKNVKHNPLSTFSIDVDNASYSNIRRYINMGQLPPPDAVRIEEMLNYFKYDYPEPSGEHPFSVYTEMAVCPWNTNHYLLQVGLRGRSIDKTSLPPSNLVFLLDVSGSMNAPNKLPLLKSAFGLLLNQLRPQDHVAIVVYAGAAGLVLESTSGNRKETIMKALDNLEAGGSTAGGAGLKLAYAQADKHFIKGGNNRIILATDGDFNVGESSNGGMERLIEEKRELGVFITVLGFGMGNIKDDKMEIIADKGNGNYSYIDNLQEARKVLVSEFGGTLFTIAKDVKFQIEFNPARVESYRLIGYENRLLNDEDFNDDKKDAGEMGAGHNVTALFELVPAGSGEDITSIDPLKYQAGRVTDSRKENLSGEYVTVKLRYKKPDGKSSMLFDKVFKGSVKGLEDASDNLRFAAAVTEFGMILRDSEFKGTATYEEAVRLARLARGGDEDGYRYEMIRLINTAKDIRVLADKK